MFYKECSNICKVRWDFKYRYLFNYKFTKESSSEFLIG